MPVSTADQIAGMNHDELLARLKDSARLRRFLGLGARPEDLFGAYQRIERLDQWPGELASVAQGYEQAGDQVTVPHASVASWLTACVYYHLATLGVFEDNDQRVGLYRTVERVYRKAAPHLPVPAEVVSYTFRGVPFTAYLRTPSVPADGGGAPVLLLLRGQDAAREVELHTISELMLHRGFATFAIDLAGQGESRLHGMRMPDDLAESAGAAIDQLEGRPGLDLRRLAVLGQSFGGHLAPRVAAGEPRIKACIALAGFYALSDMERPPLARHNFMMNMGGDPETARQRESLFTLDGLIENLTCPFFAVNGAQDRVTPPSQTVKLYERAVRSRARNLKLYEGLPHCAYYDNRAILFDLADWLLEMLP